MKRLANRTREIELFLAMTDGRNDRRILLIEAKSGYGKTDLISRFADQCPSRIVPVRLDLKTARELGIAYVFYRIRKVLATQQFPAYEAAIAQLLHPDKTTVKIEIEGNDLSGDQSAIQVVLQGRSEAERQIRLQQVQGAFFKDLRQCLSSFMFILDTFNEATPELQQWVAGNFLMEVADHAQFYAVVAGQEVPKPSIEWEAMHHKCCLSPIREHTAWYTYARDAGYTFDQQDVGVLVDLFQGVPYQVGEALNALWQNRQQV
jgi:hypothetical protein